MTPCPHCNAPAPVVGDVTHAWDCPANGAPKRFDWDRFERLSRYYIPDTTFTPLPPLRTLTWRERAALVAVARECERGWEARRERRPKGAAA